jgi:hypothetical protein
VVNPGLSRKRAISKSSVGRRPVSRRIDINELDPDDELILELKRDGVSDKAIAERFEQDGRTRYNHKSINSRWCRIRDKLRYGVREDQIRKDVQKAKLTWTEDDVNISC